MKRFHNLQTAVPEDEEYREFLRLKEKLGITTYEFLKIAWREKMAKLREELDIESPVRVVACFLVLVSVYACEVMWLVMVA